MRYLKPLRRGALALCLAASMAAQAQDSTLNVICSVQVEWCNLIQTTFSRVTGIKVNMVQRSTGEALAQINAERANPKTDLWFGGTGDPHLAAAAQGLTEVYRSPVLPQLHAWAQRQAEQSGYRTVGIYLGPLGFAYNTELLAKRRLPVPRSWADLLRPEFKGELQMANPASSGGAYTAVATMIQVMGEEKAWDYMARLHRNISTYPRSGEAPIKAVSRGEASAAIVFIALGPGEKAQGFPVETLTPSEGTGAEIGAMSIIKGAPHPQAARQLYDWALTPQAQQFAFAARGFQVPSHKATPLDPRVPDIKKLKLIDYDYAKYGAPAERQRIIKAWDTRVRSLPQ
ncbi:MAG: ABC transporter substrate-binding protein [Rubrivivax sp.]|nr:ABC transporter substrate-binding protein [Rubrivivax sp.]